MKKVISFITIITIISFALYACKNKAAKTSAASAPVIADSAKLNGNWQMNYITGATSFDSLYPAKIPAINFDVVAKKISGNTGCNSFSGKLVTDGNKISFADPMIMTKMFCPGDGEPLFLQNLQKVETYLIVNDTTLNFMMGEIAIMKFVKKP
jgi:heat shock protein HslJ